VKAIVQNLQNGKLQVDEVPPPALRPGGILVRVQRSLISLGTERAVIALANKGPIGKALDRPDLFRKVLTKARNEGYWSTYKIVRNLISSPIPLGYSCAGEVIAVGAEAVEFSVGDRVACAGLNFANHAEVDYVPRNLAAKIPDALSYDDACFVTAGAIAIHGVRLAKIELGETVVVMGLGLVGQITAQVARCAGANVVATDLDSSKVVLAKQLGAHHAIGDPAALAATVAELTNGLGADAVLICAATKSDDPIRQAAELSRLKGRVVVVGDVGMQIERRPYFEKELTLTVSRSYGPGRYDPAYEERGTDYPLPYVRWTEGRNMQSFLELQARQAVRVGPLVTHRFTIDAAETAYQIVTGERQEPAIAIVLEYPETAPHASRIALRPTAAPRTARDIRIGVIGAGQFAKGVLLPAFVGHKSVHCRAICTVSGLTSKAAAERYGATYCTSDPGEIIRDAEIDAVVIATRHDQHAALTAAALAAGKAVFVEKPLALTPESLLEVCNAARSAEAPRLMVGYNRRFAPLAVRCKEFFAGRREPISILYRVNAGSLPADSWVLDPVQGGGRVVGEICHFVDTICFLTDAVPQRIFAEQLVASGSAGSDRQNVTVTLRMSDGSVAVIHYTANGDPALPKEYVEVFSGQQAAILDDYRRLSVYRNNRMRRHRLFNQAKGHAEEVGAFVDALRTGGPMPIVWETLLAVTQTTFLIHRSLDCGGPVDYEAPGLTVTDTGDP
jgi:predicted dehydrogenase/threonine dehydrogenase-like Zn-dependent dehydrogenase